MNISKLLGLAFLLLVTISFSSCDKDEDEVVEEITLTVEQSNMLIYMREEEKLARDVYLHLFDKYNEQIFSNIAGAEQKHMDKILDLLNKYGYDDPATMTRGTFSNEELQSLYNELIDKGEVSLIDALIVGATVEDVDIFDLDRASILTTQTDILNIYEKLNCGSRNHMRAFTRQLTNNNQTYTAQFISATDYDNIINSSNEKCGNK